MRNRICLGAFQEVSFGALHCHLMRKKKPCCKSKVFPVFSSVRFDQDSACRLLPETRVSWPRSGRELLSTIHSPASHPLQGPLGATDAVGRPWPSGSPEEIHGLDLSQTALCHQEIHRLAGGDAPQRWAPREESSGTGERPRGASGPSRQETPPSQLLQARREATATLLWETEEMYVRAFFSFYTHEEVQPLFFTFPTSSGALRFSVIALDVTYPPKMEVLITYVF